MKVAALAGGVGAGKFLRGLVRAVRPEDVTVIVNTADDIALHGLHVSPDLDSVTYWMAGLAERQRGWGRAGESWRAAEELRRLGAPGAWFSLGDLDLATHLFRTSLLDSGATLSEATARIVESFGVRTAVLPMTDDPVETRIEVVHSGTSVNLHFQEYWVERRAADQVKAVRYRGAETAHPAPGVLEALRTADAIVLPPSNPVASIEPILAVPGIRDGLVERRDRVAGVSGIVDGAPLAGMADKLLPVAGVEVTAAGVAELYRDHLAGWVIDRADARLARRIEDMGIRVAVTDTIMDSDRTAEDVARRTLSLL